VSAGERPRRGALRIIGYLAGSGVIAGVLAALIAVSAVGLVGMSARNASNWFRALPSDLRTPPIPQRSVVLAADGSTLATFYYENRVDVPIAQVSPVMRRAIVAIEDTRFYEHGGLDIKATVRAMVDDLVSGQVEQGGSGITQQYVKNLLIETASTAAAKQAAQAETPARKIRELRYAVAVENELTKDQILQDYLNIAYFGDGAYGVEAAARHYFGVHASRLTLAQAALLAGIVRYPLAYDPTSHPGQSVQRRNVVLARMAQIGQIDQAQLAAAEQAPIGLHVTATPNGCVESGAPFFCDYVQDEILTNPIFGATQAARKLLLQRGGLTISTTLDPRMQKAAQHAVNDRVPPKNPSHKAAAEVLIQPGTGQIKALAVDRAMGNSAEPGKVWVDFAADTDHGSSEGMQAGSTFKIFTLAAALDQGMPFGARLSAPNEFEPTGYTDCQGRPVGDPTTMLGNAADGEGGRTFSLLTGTWNSVNTFFLNLERKVGLCATVKMAQRLGMRRADGSPLQQVASFTLGPNTVSPVRLAAAYAAFAARGKYCSPIAIARITNATGKPIAVPNADCHQAVRKGVADAVNHVLQGVLTSGTAAGEGIGRPAAGKTGTVDDYSSAWFAGYTPDLASAVWVGDPRGGYAHPLRDLCLGGRCYGEVFGADIPAPIWHDTMEAALRGVAADDFHEPPSKYYSEGSGLDLTTVSDVRGLSVSAAEAKLRAVGLDPVVSYTEVRSGTYAKGKVADTDPGPGSRVEPGSTVTIHVSKGKKPKTPHPGPSSSAGVPAALAAERH
jgi:membrane peptidoglycan carboxypeptidase